jgi:hypothetical protein
MSSPMDGVASSPPTAASQWENAAAQIPKSPTPATQKNTSKAPPQAVSSLIGKLEQLFLIKEAEAYRELWKELKIGVGHLSTSKRVTVTVSDERVAKLTEAVEALVRKQSSTSQAQANTASTYAAALRAGLSSSAPTVREVPTRLAREIIVTNPEASTQDRARPIAQIVEEINKTKGANVLGNVLAARRLPSGDVLITADTAATKEQLERDPNWLPAISQAARVNRRRFPVMVHGMRVAALDCSW